MGWKETLKKIGKLIWKHRKEIEEFTKNGIDYFNAGIPKEFPKDMIHDKGTLNEFEIRKIIEEQTFHADKVTYMIGDAKYKITDLATIKLIIPLLNIVQWRKYKRHEFDCDDYSSVFHGIMKFVLPQYCIGEVWEASHALNFCIVKNDEEDKYEFYYIEPQNSKIFKNNLMKVEFIKL